jgi:hypothetical protein
MKLYSKEAHLRGVCCPSEAKVQHLSRIRDLIQSSRMTDISNESLAGVLEPAVMSESNSCTGL